MADRGFVRRQARWGGAGEGGGGAALVAREPVDEGDPSGQAGLAAIGGFEVEAGAVEVVEVQVSEGAVEVAELRLAAAKRGGAGGDGLLVPAGVEQDGRIRRGHG